MARIHLLTLPTCQTTKDYYLCGFNMMNRRMIDLLHRMGHTVFVYGSEDIDVPCTELITTISKAELAPYLNQGDYQNARQAADNPLWMIANPRMAAEIGKRKQPRDLILTVGGNAHLPVTTAHPDLMDVEYSIGYVGNCMRYRVFESRVWQHHCYGQQSMTAVRYFDDVIPGFLDETLFRPVGRKESYIAYVGRLVPLKGIGTACDAARAAGVPLKIVGHGNRDLITYGDDLGTLTVEERNAVMANAAAVICPTHYIEPFNYVGIEAQMLGTPVIAPPQGGFVETVVPKVSGWHCASLGDYARAMKAAIDKPLSSIRIRNRAVEEYGIKTAMKRYQTYFDRLDTIWDKGWNTL